MLQVQMVQPVQPGAPRMATCTKRNNNCKRCHALRDLADLDVQQPAGLLAVTQVAQEQEALHLLLVRNLNATPIGKPADFVYRDPLQYFRDFE